MEQGMTNSQYRIIRYSLLDILRTCISKLSSADCLLKMLPIIR